MKNEIKTYLEPTHREEQDGLELDESSDNDLHILNDEESPKNINFQELSVESIVSEELKNPILDKINTCDTIDSPIRLNTNEQKPYGFSSLKTDTFDNNFKDINRLKRKHELLALSKRSLYSKLYTPKLEALQKLVEPGKYHMNNHVGYNQKSSSSISSTNLQTRCDFNNSDTTTKTQTFDSSYTYDLKYDASLASTNRNLSDFNSNFDFLDLDKNSTDISLVDTETSNNLILDTFKDKGLRLKEETQEQDGYSDKNDLDDFEKLNDKSVKTRLDTTKRKLTNVLTLKSSSEYVNGKKKKRVQIPINAYKTTLTGDGTIDKSHKIILKLVPQDPKDKVTGTKNLLELIEEKLEKIANSIELYGDKILNPETIMDELDSLRPENMDKSLFMLLCLKPIGMDYNEYFKSFGENNFNGLLNQLHSFNLLNINAMGYVLDAEYEILKEFNRLGRIHQKLINEDMIYSKILATMQENFMSQAEDLLKTTRQDLRLEVGYSHLRWGRIKNVVSWKPGDPIIREKGFAQDMASTNKMKTLQRMEQAFGTTNATSPYSPNSQLPTNEAHYIYYIKTLQSLEEREQEMLQLQVSRDRMQTLSEFSVIGPYHKPKNSLPWKCIGLSCNSVVWKMYNTVECTPIVYKFRSLNDVGPELAEKLESLYVKALGKIRELDLKLSKRVGFITKINLQSQVLFSNSVKVYTNCVVEQMQFIKHSPFSLLLEKSAQFNSSERFAQTQVVIREVVRMLNHMKDLSFILPLKSSRIYFNNGGVILSGGVPLSLLGSEGISLLKKHSVNTIATLLWGKNLDWYLPPEAKGDPLYTKDPILISKAHTWMIGKMLYESIFLSTTHKNDLDYSKIEMCEHEVTREFMKICLERNPEDRPTIDKLVSYPYLKKVKLNYGTIECENNIIGAFVPMDVPKVRCAVEFLGDIETIVLNKMRKTEKGVADYEQYDDGDIKFVESNGNNAEMVIFTSNTILRWMEESKIVSVSWCHGRIFIGNNLGQICSFKLPSVTKIVDTDEKLKINVSKKPIVYISSLEPREEILALDSEGDLFVVNIHFKARPVVLSKKVSCFTRQAIESYEEIRGCDRILPITYMANICVGLKQKIQIFSAIGENIVHQRNISISETPLTICWLNNTIVIGSSVCYSMTRPDGTCYTELCRNDNSLDRRQNNQINNKNIITCTCVDKDVMVVCHNIGVFYNTETMNLSKKNTIQWSGTLESLGSCPPFIVGLTSKKKIEIHGIRDQLLYKTLELRSSATSYFMPDKCNFLCATPTNVTVVQPSSYYENIANSLQNDKIKDALQLVNLYFSNNDPRRMTEISICHTVAGWIYFSKLNFPSAFLHFSQGKADIVYLLSFWDHYYPLKVPESYHLNKIIPPFFQHLVPKTEKINKFIENTLSDPEFTKFNQMDKTKKELLELANCSFTLFLSKYTKLNQDDFGESEEMVEFYKRLVSAVETVTFLLFAESNDLRYNIILNKDKSGSNIDVDATKNHLIDMNKGDLYARLLIRDGRVIEAMDVLADLSMPRNLHSLHLYGTGGSNSQCKDLASCINLVLYSIGKSGNSDNTFTVEEIKDMLYTYLPLLFESSPTSALGVLTKNHSTIPLTSDEILSMINEHAKKSLNGNLDMAELQIKYLEDLVLKNKSGGVHENTLLAKYYLNSISAMSNFNVESKQGFENKNDKKTMLFQLLEGNYNFELNEIEDMICNLDIPEAKIIIYSKLGKHFQSLETIYTKWSKNQVKLCEAYCLCFSDITNINQLNKENPYKRLFTYYDYWIDKAEEWPLSQPNLYVVDQESETSIDNLILKLLKIIVSHTSDKSNTTIAKHLLSKYIHFTGHNSALNGINILEVIPRDWNFNEFADLFNHLHLRMLHNQRTKSIKKGLARSLHSKTSMSLYKLTSLPPVKIDTNTLCIVCSEPIKIGTSIAIKIPQQKDSAESGTSTRQPLVAHEYCIRKGHIN